ncbi:MAG TPA: chlorohydrolase family protein [Chloroflexota bacterium]|jgi:cytosine/adenosine deaminase-related metal-dependent hydrolase
MRTLIQGGWVVGFDGTNHELWRDGVVVYEDNRIVYVGHAFGGSVDRTIDARGKLVSPGLINCHIHAGINAPHALLNDPTKTNYFAQNFLAYGARLPSGPRQNTRVEVESTFGMWAALRGGATTILDVGLRPPNNAPAFTDMVGRLGMRAYLGPLYGSAGYVLDEDGRIDWQWDAAAGEAGLEVAKRYIREYNGTHNDRIRGILYPAQLDTCTPELLQATKHAAAELGVGIQLHTAMNLVEFHKLLRERQVTPIEYLKDLGFLGPEVILGHCVFHNRHSWAHYPYGDDLAILAGSGCSVAHAPYKYAKQGLALESFDEYRHRGINICLGTDTFPQDIVSEMRLAALACRWAEGSFLAGKPKDVFYAATLGGAKALGRDDLGRLAPGAKADLLIVDLRQMHFGAVRDPIKSLVEAGSQKDIDTIVVDGETLVEHGRTTRVDEPALLAQVQAAGEDYWATLPQWRAKGQTIDDVAPMSFPVHLSF